MKKYTQFKELVSKAKSIVIIQADNPDGDSIGSSLALEQILGDLGKNTYMYCRVDVPAHLKYLSGWDRIENELPKDFDLSIIVDCSSNTLLSNIKKNGDLAKLKKKPFIVLDHHIDGEDLIDFANLQIIENYAATGELIFNICKELGYKVNKLAASALAVSIMSDTLGLVSKSTSSNTIRAVADLVDLGVDLTLLDEARKETNRKSPELLLYKAELIKRIEYYRDNSITLIVIPWQEIKKYSSIYNPPVLVMEDMKLVEGCMIAIALKHYQDGHITAKIRCNLSAPIAKELNEHFGGGGHKFAGGFKIESDKNTSIEKIKQECIEYTSKLLDKISK